MRTTRGIRFLTLLIAAAAIAGPAWAVFCIKPSPDYYRVRAEAACKCARLKSDAASKEACWRDFDAVTANARAEAGPTACFPLSEVSITLPDGSWLTTSWGIVGSNEEFCTEEEAISAEALYASIDTPATIDLPPRQQSEVIARGIAALEKLSRDYARGEQITLARAYGCVSGMP